jgi:hypothetical protein
MAGADKKADINGTIGPLAVGGPLIQTRQVISITATDQTLDPAHLVGGLILLPDPVGAIRVLTLPTAAKIVAYVTGELAGKVNSLAYVNPGGYLGTGALTTRTVANGPCPIMSFSCDFYCMANSGNSYSITPVASTFRILAAVGTESVTVKSIAAADTWVKATFFILNTTVGSEKVAVMFD